MSNTKFTCMRNMRMTLTVIFQSISICQTIPLKICQFLVSSSLLQTALNAKHWKSASFSNLPLFILLDLTNNLITYSSFLIALHFFSILALFLLFSFHFVSSCLLALFIPVASPLFFCILILSVESPLPLLLSFY